MKLYLLTNESRYSQIVEACSGLERNAESAKVERFISGEAAPELEEPLKVRVHFRAAKPLPLPDFCRGTDLCFVSAQGKSIIEQHFGEFVQFVPVDIVGLGVDNGKSWRPSELHESPFSEIPAYFVLHIPRVAEILDATRSKVVRDSIGEMPQLLPVGQFQRLAFNRDAAVPPLFALPCHANYPLVSGEFVEVAKRQRLLGFKPVEVFDTEVDFEFEGVPIDDEGALVSLDEAVQIASVRAREVHPFETSDGA